jgi:hypothetical protein
MEKITELVKYREKYGDCNVPVRCVEDPPLGHWVSNLRSLICEVKLEDGRPKLPKNRIVGFQWEVRGRRCRLISQSKDHLKICSLWIAYCKFVLSQKQHFFGSLARSPRPRRARTPRDRSPTFELGPSCCTQAIYLGCHLPSQVSLIQQLFGFIPIALFPSARELNVYKTSPLSTTRHNFSTAMEHLGSGSCLRVFVSPSKRQNNLPAFALHLRPRTRRI